MGVNYMKQKKINTAEPLVPELSPSDVQTATENFKKYKLTSMDQIMAELIQVGSNTLHSDIHKLCNSIWSKEELPQQWNISISVPIYKSG
jgi:hypothetical protein